jgi:EAL domain-containing protein (putative c-di-GMP-specific phosphodiesterase class I)
VCQLDVPHFADEVIGMLSTTGLDPTNVVLEVTESILADPKGGAPSALAALRRTGLRVALDDFGTGYSSIGYLRQLPVDILKIDRSFVADTTPDGRGNAVLEAIVAMADHLGLDIIPEGIEDFDQLSRLRAMGCQIGQGFLLSRPVSADAIETLLASPVPLLHVAAFEPVAAQLTQAELPRVSQTGLVG